MSRRIQNEVRLLETRDRPAHLRRVDNPALTYLSMKTTGSHRLDKHTALLCVPGHLRVSCEFPGVADPRFPLTIVLGMALDFEYIHMVPIDVNKHVSNRNRSHLHRWPSSQSYITRTCRPTCPGSSSVC